MYIKNRVLRGGICVSKGSKQQFKQFPINSIQDACHVLGMMISGVIVHLTKYKEYSGEANDLLENCDTEFIPAKQYEDIKDKLLYRQFEILKLIADCQSSSFSYIELRKLLKKKQYLKTQLPENISSFLNELLDVRNWTFHNPQSLTVAAKEAAEKTIPDYLKAYLKIQPQLNPVIVQVADKYETRLLASFVLHTQSRIERFEAILKNMQSDYQEMYDSIENKPYLLTRVGFSSVVQYRPHFVTMGLFGYHNDVAQISMAIQKSKYDGTEEMFNKWVIHPKEVPAEESEKNAN